MKQIKTAIFGTGFVGRVHLNAVRPLWNRSRPLPIVDTNVDLAQRLAEGFDIAAAADYPTILRDPAIDAVHICTPNAEHFPWPKRRSGGQTRGL